MKKAIIFDTAVGSLNKGDEIIMMSAKSEIYEIIKNFFILIVPTHTPVFHWYQTISSNPKIRFMKEVDLKFVCGTNLLYTNMLRPWPNWNINLFNCKTLNESILLGVGCGINSNKINWYTRKLYNLVLSKQIIHSVRDDKTKNILEDIGFKAINTGCPTLWSLTTEFCNNIPKNKSTKVVFTLTDYSKDKITDQILINILKSNFKEIYFWPQGSGDYNYLKSFENIEDIIVIPPSVEEFSKILNQDIDYIGTRLHGGIFSMKHGRRSIIISVDHRAREMNKTYNLNCIERVDILNLSNLINSEFSTNIKLNEENINLWKNQFK